MDRKPGGYYPEERATGGWLGNAIAAVAFLAIIGYAIWSGL